MHWSSQLLTVASIWSVATVSPGPNFLLTAQVAAAQSRLRGLAVVGGIAVATAIWGICGLLGIQALFVAAPWAFVTLKLAGALYLVFTGVRLIAYAGKAPSAAPIAAGLSPWRAFGIGLVTSLANPRSALSVASVFAVALPAQPSLPIGLAAATLMVAISVGWYICVVYMFATGIVANAYQRLRRWIDRIAGGLLILFGVRLALDRG